MVNNGKVSSYIKKIPYDEKYTKRIHFVGNFTKCIDEIKSELNRRKYYSFHKYYDRINRLVEFRCETIYQNKACPYSKILYKNDYYNFGFYNCLHASLYYLKYGVLKKNNTGFQNGLREFQPIPIPNNFYEKIWFCINFVVL